MSTGRSYKGNLLLNILPHKALKEAGWQEQEYALREVLIGGEETPDYAYFPHAGAVASIIRATSTGQMVEAGVVGGEGMFNVHSVLVEKFPKGNQAVVQGKGQFGRIEVVALRVLLDDHPSFRDAVLRYVSIFLDQVTQNLVCNRLHTIEQRLAKWLLVMRDRIPTDQLNLTQEFVSYMLGVQRPGVSIAITALENDGLIRHRRNWIELRDREGIAARSCECYRPIHDRLQDFTAAFGVMPG